jgi:hypothetical protein
MLPIEEIINENFEEELRRKKKQNTGENMPPQLSTNNPWRKFELIWFEVTLPVTNWGGFDQFRHNNEYRETGRSIAFHPYSFDNYINNTWLRIGWSRNHPSIPGTSPDSVTIIDSAQLNEAIRENRRSYRIHGIFAFQEHTLRLVNIREITNE